MEQKYKKNQIENLKRKYIELNNIISGLDSEYDRHFTLDGHLVGSIGEVLASYYYGINLFKASEKIHDGIVDGRYVQIKITQRNSVVIKDQPDFLLVLQLEQNGDISEVYNGPGYLALEIASEKDSYNHRHMQINRLIEQSRKVDDSLRIEQKYPVPCLWKTDENYKFADNISLKKTESVHIDRFKESKKKIAEANKKHLFDDDNLLLSDIKSSNFIEIWDRKEEKKVCDCGGKLRTSSGVEVYFHSENEMVSVLMDGEKCLDCNKIFVVKDKALDCIRQINEISVEIKNNNKGQVKFHL